MNLRMFMLGAGAGAWLMSIIHLNQTWARAVAALGLVLNCYVAVVIGKGNQE